MQSAHLCAVHSDRPDEKGRIVTEFNREVNVDFRHSSINRRNFSNFECWVKTGIGLARRQRPVGAAIPALYTVIEFKSGDRHGCAKSRQETAPHRT